MTNEAMSDWAAPAFWTELCPWLTISDLPFQKSAAQAVPRDPDASERRTHQLAEGHTRFDDILPTNQVEPLRQAVELLHDQGLPTPFLYLFDETWQLYASLSKTIEVLVGSQFLIGGDLWVWHLPPSADSAGWAPHRDDQFAAEGFNSDGDPTHVSLWVALSDADTTNGCMYVLPKNRTAWNGGRSTAPSLAELASVRALPARAGTVLSWTSDVLHWGSRSTNDAKAARTSMCIYAQRADHPMLTTDMVRLTDPVPFVHRLGVICRALIRYRDSQLHRGLSASEELLAFASEHEQRFQKWLGMLSQISSRKSP